MSLPPDTVHVAVAALNQTVGDWSGNLSRAREAIARARARGATFLVLPEMCLSGYSIEDRLLMRGTVSRSWASLEALKEDTAGMVVLAGLPIRHRDVLYNAVAVLADRQLCGIVPKEHLANGDVHYENRWFSGWPRGLVETYRTADGDVPLGTLLFEAEGIGPFGVEICEDGWQANRPGSDIALAGATLIANPSASWFAVSKHAIRRQLVQQVSRQDRVAYLYTSLIGCDATRLVFDGAAFIAQEGSLLAEGQRFGFCEEVYVTDAVVDLSRLRRQREGHGSWRQQVERQQRGEVCQPQRVSVAGQFGSPGIPNTPLSTERDASLEWLQTTDRLTSVPTADDVPFLELELALSLGLHEYRKKTGVSGFCLALSGGRDSAMVAYLVRQSLHYAGHEGSVADRFDTAYMATENSGDATRAAARQVSADAGATHHEVDLQSAFDTHLALFQDMTGVALSWHNEADDLPLQNVQARLRGSMIWMLANTKGHLLLATSNKSEAAVGYTTMDGDTSGGLAPIADVPKTLVTRWLTWAGSFHGWRGAQMVSEMPATAELRPPDESQTDEDDLMPFAVLDRLMHNFVALGQEPVVLFDALWPELREHYQNRPEAFAADIRRFITLLCRAQWKRERFAISFRVGNFDLDPRNGFRFPPVQQPFTHELEDLDARVAALQLKES